MKRRRFAESLMMAALFSVTCCVRSGVNEAYDYSTPDIVNNDCYLDFESISGITPAVTKVLDVNEHISGYMMESVENSLGTGSAFFWYGTPETEMPEGGYPAVLLIHGGDGNAYSDWVDFWNKRGYAALALDINGHMFDESGNLVRNQDFLVNGSWGSVGCAVDEEGFRSSWTGVNLADCVLADNYLRNIETINKDEVFVTGISWGGYLTSILSGIDKRFAGFAPVYGCGYMHHDSWGLSNTGLGSMSETERDVWASCYDPSSYLEYSTKPMLFVGGMDDPAFSSVSRTLSADLVPGKLFYCYSNSLAHGHYYGLTPCVEEFFNDIIAKEKFDRNLVSYELKDGVLMIEMKEATDSADLNITESTDVDSHCWKWSRYNLELKQGKNYTNIDDSVTAVTVSFFEGGMATSYSTGLLMNKNIDDYI